MFVFNVTATTETYTDGHTLSLHDALPISAVAVAASAVRPFCLRGRSLLRSPFASAAVLSLPRVCCFFCCLPLLLLLLPLPLLLLCRSEEHTSELQSLMRISYAVFCLKKKNILLAYTFLISLISYVN